LIAVSCERGASTRGSAASTLRLSPCHVDSLTEEIFCGVHEVFEDRDRDSGRRIPLHVAVLPALRPDAEPDPLFLMAGGPGQGARELSPAAARDFRAGRRRRDTVLADLRGTGASAPLACGPSGDEIAALEEPDVARVARDCASAIDTAPRFYTHRHSLADLNEVRARLGYARINLWGGSWGTRASLLFALRYPDVTRTVVLDGAAALTMEFPRSASADAQAALDRVLDRCAADVECRKAFPAPRADLERFRQRFHDGTTIITIRHPRTHRPPSRFRSAWRPTSFAAPCIRPGIRRQFSISFGTRPMVTSRRCWRSSCVRRRSRPTACR
jgi:pimeloyl-ACP methyl ester carboxylesterase